MAPQNWRNGYRGGRGASAAFAGLGLIDPITGVQLDDEDSVLPGGGQSPPDDLVRDTLDDGQTQPLVSDDAPATPGEQALRRRPILQPPGFSNETTQLLRQLVDSNSRIERLLYLILSSQTDAPVTDVGDLFTGDKIGALNQYVSLFQNKTGREIRVQVFVPVWGTPGEGIKLSLGTDLSDVGLIDILANSANGKNESVAVLLKPQQTLWINVNDVNFPLTAATIIRTKVFDPQNFLSLLGVGV